MTRSMAWIRGSSGPALFENGLYGRMIVTDSIAHTPVALFGPPRFGEWFLPAHLGNLPPVSKNAPRPLADVFRKAERPAAQFDRWAGCGLADINFPVGIGAVRDIDADSRQPVSFLRVQLRPWPSPSQPPATRSRSLR